MFSPFVLLSLLALFASQALAFSIKVGNQDLAPADILAIPDSPVTQACTADCSVASSALANCQDDACFCSAATVDPLVNCENCMLHFLIAKNKPAPDFRAGSNPVVGAYATACKTLANVTLAANQSALVLPATWDGPFVAVLPTPAAAVTVAIGTILGFSALFILSNLE